MSEYVFNYLSLHGMVPSIVINDVLDELRAENDRLSGELVFANKCLHVLLKFKHYFYKNYLNVNNSNTQCNNSDNRLKELENEFDVLLRENKEKLFGVFGNNNNISQINDEIRDQQIIDNNEKLTPLFVSTREENAQTVCETKSEQIIDKTLVKYSFISSKVIKLSVNKSKTETKGRETEPSKRKRAKSHELVCDWNECHYIARKGRELLDHKNRHLGVKPYSCSTSGCCKTFYSEYMMKKHFKFVHELKNTIPCEWKGCSKMFKNISSLNKHMKIHEIPVEERPYVCDVIGCSYRTLSNCNLETHKIKHSEQKLFKCSECERSFKSEQRLKTHQQIHEVRLKFSCDYPDCNAVYQQFKTLKRHKQKVHENMDLKVFRCDWPGCEFRSERKVNIKEHMDVHTDERKFVCTWPSCEQKFKYERYLKHHLKIHMNDKRHACQWPGCDYRCVHTGSLNRHLRVHRKD